MIVFCAFRTPLPSLLDSATVAELKGRTSGYSRIRAWGSLSFALGAGLAGLLDRAERVETVVGIAAAMYLASGFFALGLDAPPIHREPQVLRKAAAHIKGAGLIPIFAASALYYSAHSVFDIHFSLFMDRIDARDLVGPSWMLGVLCEVAIMFAAPAFLKARAPKNVLIAASLIATFRWFVLSLVPARPFIVAVEALHGVTFGVWYLSLVRVTQENAPEELRSSVQAAMLTAVGVGTVVGYVIGGLILERMGGAWMWRIAAMTTAASAIVYSMAAARGSAAPPKR
jgi:MFS family permease